ncbi:MAG: hypothetical protein VKI82_14365 [Leptolyngbya sp.]|nr:hypothetical protein [Leptolyngbya sp.]
MDSAQALNAVAPDPARFLPLAPDFVIELRSASAKWPSTEIVGYA